MYSLHCTKKLLDRLKRPIAEAVDSETRLGNWYATVLFWKPQFPPCQYDLLHLPPRNQ